MNHQTAVSSVSNNWKPNAVLCVPPERQRNGSLTYDGQRVERLSECGDGKVLIKISPQSSPIPYPESLVKLVEGYDES